MGVPGRQMQVHRPEGNRANGHGTCMNERVRSGINVLRSCSASGSSGGVCVCARIELQSVQQSYRAESKVRPRLAVELAHSQLAYRPSGHKASSSRASRYE